jgi:Lon-like ATP-dependent protease
MRLDAKAVEDNTRMLSFFLSIGWFILTYVIWRLGWLPDVVYAATLILGGFLFIGIALGSQMKTKAGNQVPKLLIDNAGKKIAPFFEATGARAGALLGDVRHDPLQSFYGFNELYLQKRVRGKLILAKKPFNELWDAMVSKYEKEIIKDKKGREAIMLPLKEKVFTLGYKNGKVVLSRILSLNRQPFEGELVELKVKDKKIALTPEHKVITEKADKCASRISGKDFLISLSSG